MPGVLPSRFFPYSNTVSINTDGAGPFLTPILQGGTPEGRRDTAICAGFKTRTVGTLKHCSRILAETNVPKNHNIGEK